MSTSSILEFNITLSYQRVALKSKSKLLNLVKAYKKLYLSKPKSSHSLNTSSNPTDNDYEHNSQNSSQYTQSTYYTSIDSSIAHLIRINYLDFSFIRLSFDDCLLLRNLFCNKTNIIEVNLSTCGLDKTMITLIAHGLMYNTSILHIDLSQNNINDEGCSFLAFALNSNFSIVSIFLKDNPITTKRCINSIKYRISMNVNTRVSLTGCIFNKLNLSIFGDKGVGKTLLISNLLNNKISNSSPDQVKRSKNEIESFSDEEIDILFNSKDPFLNYRNGEEIYAKIENWNLEVYPTYDDEDENEDEDEERELGERREVFRGEYNKRKIRTERDEEEEEEENEKEKERRNILIWKNTNEYELYKLLSNKNDFMKRFSSIQRHRKRQRKRFRANSSNNEDTSEIIIFPYHKVNSLKLKVKNLKKRDNKVKKRKESSSSSVDPTSRISIRRKRSTQTQRNRQSSEIRQKRYLRRMEKSISQVFEEKDLELEDKEDEYLPEDGKCSLDCIFDVEWSKKKIVGPEFISQQKKNSMHSFNVNYSKSHRLSSRESNSDELSKVRYSKGREGLQVNKIFLKSKLKYCNKNKIKLLKGSYLTFKNDLFNITLKEYLFSSKLNIYLFNKFIIKQGIYLFLFNINNYVNYFKNNKNIILLLLNTATTAGKNEKNNVKIFFIATYDDLFYQHRDRYKQNLRLKGREKEKRREELKLVNQIIKKMFNKYLKYISKNEKTKKYFYLISNITKKGIYNLKLKINKQIKQFHHSIQPTYSNSNYSNNSENKLERSNSCLTEVVPMIWCQCFIFLHYKCLFKDKVPFVNFSSTFKLSKSKFKINKVNFYKMLIYFTNLGYLKITPLSSTFSSSFNENTFIILNLQFYLNLFTKILIPNKKLENYYFVEKNLERINLRNELNLYYKHGYISDDILFYIYSKTKIYVDRNEEIELLGYNKEFIYSFIKHLKSSLLIHPIPISSLSLPALAEKESEGEGEKNMNLVSSFCEKYKKISKFYKALTFRNINSPYYEIEFEFSSSFYLSSNIFHSLISSLLLSFTKHKKRTQRQKQKELEHVNRLSFNRVSSIQSDKEEEEQRFDTDSFEKRFKKDIQKIQEQQREKNLSKKKKKKSAMMSSMMKRKRRSQRLNSPLSSSYKPKLKTKMSAKDERLQLDNPKGKIYQNLAHLFKDDPSKEMVLFFFSQTFKKRACSTSTKNKSGENQILKVLIRNKNIVRKVFMLVKNCLVYLHNYFVKQYNYHELMKYKCFIQIESSFIRKNREMNDSHYISIEHAKAYFKLLQEKFKERELVTNQEMARFLKQFNHVFQTKSNTEGNNIVTRRKLLIHYERIKPWMSNLEHASDSILYFLENC